jgi:hypothetical protein
MSPLQGFRNIILVLDNITPFGVAGGWFGHGSREMSPLRGCGAVILALDNITPLGLRVAGLGMVQEKCHPFGVAGTSSWHLQSNVTPSGFRLRP